MLPADDAVTGEGNAGEKKYEPTWESLDSRPVPAWFNEAKFGIFVVWGPYSVPGWSPPGSYAEWFGHQAWKKQPGYWDFYKEHYGDRFDYRQFGEKLTAERWNPDDWAELFAQAGAKYTAFSVKYHDGYCLWANTQNRALRGKHFQLPAQYADVENLYFNGWNSVDTGPRRDLVADMAKALDKVGVRLGFYYSLYEWWNPLWLTDRRRYVDEYYFPQFKEVVERYRPQFIFTDGEWEAGEDVWRPRQMLAWLFNESPVGDVIVTNDRFGGMRGLHGPVYSSEYGGGNFPPTHPWQEDRGIGASYGYNRNETEQHYDSRGQLLRMLTKVAGNGGNLLLCVGPLPDGTIPEVQRRRLLEIGQWLKVNGESIYGSKASPFWPRKLAWGSCTSKPGRLYLHVYGTPGEQIALRGLTNRVTAAYWLGDPCRTPLPLDAEDHNLTIHLPAKLPDADVSVIALEIEGEPAIDRSIHQGADGSVELRGSEAEIHGTSPVYETGGGKDNIGYWQNPQDSVRWTLDVTAPGDFDVQITYSCAEGAGGSRFVVSVAGQELTGVTEVTGQWNRFATHTLGRIHLPQRGTFTLTVQPQSDRPWKSMGLQAVRLAK